MVDPPPKHKKKEKKQNASEVATGQGTAASAVNRKATGKKLREIAVIEDKQRKGETLNPDQLAKVALKESLESLMAAGKPLTDNDLASKKRKHSGDASGSDVLTEKAKRRKKKKQVLPDASETVVADKISKGLDITSKKLMTVIIGGLPYDTPDAKLERMFGKCGEIQQLNVPRNRETGLVRGFSFITFKTKEGVEAALQFDGKKFNDRILTARLASNTPDGKNAGNAGAAKDGKDERSLFVGGLPHNITEESVREYFADAGGIETLKVPLNEGGTSKGYAFICFRDTESSAKALKLNGCDYEGYSIVVRLSGDRGKDGSKGAGKGQAKGSGKGPVELTVFVQGLGRSTTEEKLRQVFSKCGEMTHVKMPMWDEGQSRGFAFISYKDRSSVDKALKLDGTNKLSYKDCFTSVQMAIDHEQALSKRDQRSAAPEWEVEVTKVPQPPKSKSEQSKQATTDLEENPKVTGALVESTGKRMTFESDDDE